MKLLAARLVFCVVCLVSAPALCALQEVREVHYQMGTFLEITLWHADPEAARRLIRQSVREVHRLDGILSNFDPQSSVSRLNQHAGKGKITIDPELHRLLRTAHGFSVKTGGYFDVTVGPLVELWRHAGEERKLPSSRRLDEIKSIIGFRNLRLYENSEAELLYPSMAVDLGGIGKGYAVDRVVELLKQAGTHVALVNFGGSSIYALGHPPKHTSWKIAVQDTDGRLIGFLHLKNTALSSSGTMGRSWHIGGKAFGHLINPKNGLPVSQKRIATVIAPSATAAEALTKPLALLGRSALSTVQEFPGAEAMIVAEKGSLSFSRGFGVGNQWEEVTAP
jgi:thiamine biosynthesis lipoprotein ApbE